MGSDGFSDRRLRPPLRFSAERPNSDNAEEAAEQQQLQNEEDHLLGLSEHISCPLCGDFLSDAVTLTGCLHFFCRPCLLRHLSSQKSPNCCPKCFVQLGPEKPIYRHDSALQELVYKLVPDLFWRRLSRIARSRRRRPPSPSKTLSAERRLLKRQRLLQLSTSLCSPDEKISIQIDYVPLADILAANRSPQQTETEAANLANATTHYGTMPSATASPSGTVPSPTASPSGTVPSPTASPSGTVPSPTAKPSGTMPFATTAAPSGAVASASMSPEGAVVSSPTKVKKQQLFFRRFFRCSARVRVEQLKHLLELKLAMTDAYGVYFVDGTLQNLLEDDYTLEDIVHLFNWTRESPLLLHFTLAKLSQEEEEDKPPVLEEMPQLEVEGETAATAAIVHRTEKVGDGKVAAEDDRGGEIAMDTDGGGGGEIIEKNNGNRGKKDGQGQQRREQPQKQTKKTNSAPRKKVPEVQQANAATALSPPKIHSFGTFSSAAEVPMPQNAAAASAPTTSVPPTNAQQQQTNNKIEKKKHGRKDNANKMEENEMNWTTGEGTAPMPKKRKAPAKRQEKETAKRKKTAEETKEGGESSGTSDKAEVRGPEKQEEEEQKQRKDGEEGQKERDREKGESAAKGEGDQRQQTEKERADQQQNEVTPKQQQQQRDEDSAGDGESSRHSEAEKADEPQTQRQQQTQSPATSSNHGDGGQNLSSNDIGTKTHEQQQQKQHIPTMPSAEGKKEQKTPKPKAKTAPTAKTHENGGNSKAQTPRKKATPPTTTAQTQPNNNGTHQQQQQQQRHFQLGQPQQHLVGPPAVGGGVPAPFGPSQIPFPPPMAAAYAPFLQNLMQNGAAASSAYADAFGAMLAATNALLQQQRQPPTPQQHQMGQMFVGGMMGMASAGANANNAGGKVPTTAQQQKPTATTTTTKATNGTGRGMPSMANGGGTTAKANSGSNGTNRSKSSAGGATKSPAKALPTMGRGEDRPSMVGQAPTSAGKSGGGGGGGHHLAMANGATEQQQQHRQPQTKQPQPQQQTSLANGQYNRNVLSASVPKTAAATATTALPRC